MISGLITTISIVSANFWRKREYCIRRDCDLILTKKSYGVQCYNAAKYICGIKNLLMYYPCFIITSYANYTSNELYNNKNDKWLYYHITMHLSVISELLVLLNSIKESKKTGVRSFKNIAVIMSMNSLYIIGMSRLKNKMCI